jgi:hypothetical protein
VRNTGAICRGSNLCEQRFAQADACHGVSSRWQRAELCHPLQEHGGRRSQQCHGRGQRRLGRAWCLQPGVVTFHDRCPGVGDQRRHQPGVYNDSSTR